MNRPQFFNIPHVSLAEINFITEHHEFVVATILRMAPSIFGKYVQLEIPKTKWMRTPEIGDSIIVMEYTDQPIDYVILYANHDVPEMDIDAVFRGKSSSL